MVCFHFRAQYEQHETPREVRSAPNKTSENFDKSHIICANAFPKDLW